MKKNGIALVIAIIVLLGLSLMATAIMITAQSEMKIGAAHKWYVQAMDVAQAGLNEAIYRLKLPHTDADAIFDINDPIDPDWEAVVLNKHAPAPNGDTIFYASLQYSYGTSGILNPVLEYTDTVNTENALKIHYKHKGNQIYFYDQRHQREILGDPGLADVYSPIMVVEVTGRYGRARRKINTEIAQYSIATNVPSGLAASAVALNALITILSDRDVRADGHVCKSNTPWWTVPATEDPGDPYNGLVNPVHWTYETNVAGTEELWHVKRLDGTFHPKTNMEYDDECGKVGCIPGIVTPELAGGGLIGIVGANDLNVFGNPDVLLDPSFKTPEIWEMLGFKTEADMNNNITWAVVNTQGGFNGLMSADTATADNNDPKFIKVENDTAHGNFLLNLKGYGRGVLWVTGDAEAAFIGIFGRETFAWKGIVYVGGDVILNQGIFTNSNTWILGTLAVQGDVKVQGGIFAGQTFYILYCPTVINNVTETQAGRFLVLNWREEK